MSNEMNELFENLEEAILVFKHNAINYTNQLLKDILNNINVVVNNKPISNQILDYKIFKLFESDEQETNENMNDLTIQNKTKKKSSPLIEI